MRKMVFTALAAVLAVSVMGSSVWAGSIYGPASPLSTPGKLNLGVIYNWYGDKWEGDHGMPDIRVGQNQVAVEGAYALSKDFELYGRLGGADFAGKLEGAGYKIKDDMHVTGTAGARMIFARVNPQFSIGGNLQLNYAFSDYKDSFDYNTLRIKVKDLWDVNFALYGQFQPAKNVMIYAGPQLYYGEFKARVNDDYFGERYTANYDPKSRVGLVAGTAFTVPGVKNVKFFAETQYRDKFSLGGGIAYNF